ncbi:uncharacterized protein LOC119338438 [Triticum dicoccoides]|uniref:uncharacterized protein LOC119338438 n=1 Tax=Triticum dicoccoides TaxID=85692 RepID=UPI001891B838|nr:uncharacterized protein LOC119338438 [Triticum dicoccoides]
MGGCTPPLPRGAADGGSYGRAANGSLSGWSTTLAAGALPMDSGTARNAQASANGGEDRVQGQAAGARVHGMFVRKMQKFAGRKKSGPGRMRRRRDARCLHAQQQEVVCEVLLWMLPSGAGPRCSTPPSPSPSSIGSSARQRLLRWRSTV